MYGGPNCKRYRVAEVGKKLFTFIYYNKKQVKYCFSFNFLLLKVRKNLKAHIGTFRVPGNFIGSESFDPPFRFREIIVNFIFLYGCKQLDNLY